jgi:hypothetical protein
LGLKLDSEGRDGVKEIQGRGLRSAVVSIVGKDCRVGKRER